MEVQFMNIKSFRLVAFMAITLLASGWLGEAQAQDLNGVWTGDDGGIYYIRTVGDQVFWFGERRRDTDNAIFKGSYPYRHPTDTVIHPSIIISDFANIFHGRREGNDIRGRWYDVPKGEISSQGELHLRLEVPTSGGSSDFPVLRKMSGAGFMGSRLSLGHDRGQRVGAEFMPAGFQSRGRNLTGTWIGNDGGTYYIRETGAIVVWYGEAPGRVGEARFANVFSGAWRGGSFSGFWADVPKGGPTGNGELRIRRVNDFTLEKVDGSGSAFGATRWQRVESFYADIFMHSIRLIRRDDPFPSAEDEVYASAAIIEIDGQTMDVAGTEHSFTSKIELPVFQQHYLSSETSGRSASPNQWNYHRTIFQTVRGLDPVSPRARSYTQLGLIVFGWEKDESGDTDLAFRAWERQIRTLVGGPISRVEEPDYERIAGIARSSAIRALGGGVNPHDPLSTATRVIRWSDFRPSTLVGGAGRLYRAVEMPLVFAVGTDTGRYTLEGKIIPYYRNGSRYGPRPWLPGGR
jgi:hypothetical protein